MSDLGDAVQGVWNLLDMLGSLVRKAMRGKRTTLFREWRYRDNTWLACTVIFGGILALVGATLLIWLFVAM